MPLGQRSASPGLRMAGLGTRLPLLEGNTIRFFLHWRDLPEASGHGTRVDLDLSAFFVSEDLTRTEQIAYYHLRSTAAVHSGDLTSVPDGAAEFIDVTLPEALRQGWRYVVMTVHSFSHHPMSEVPECWAEAMSRGADPQRGEVLKASTVMQRLDLTSPALNATPFVIDLAERRLIWWELAVWESTKCRTWTAAATGSWRTCSTCWRGGACRWRTCWPCWPTTSSRTPMRPSWSSVRAGSCRSRRSGSWRCWAPRRSGRGGL